MPIFLRLFEAEHITFGDAVIELLFLRRAWRSILKYAMFSCFSVQPRCYATLEKSGVKLEFETHRYSSSFF